MSPLEVHLRTSDGLLHVNVADLCRSLCVDPDNYDNVSLFLASWLTLLSDSPLSSSSGRKPRRVFMQFIADIKVRGLKNIILDYSDLAHKLVSNTSLYGQSTLIGEWIDEFKETPVFREYHHYFRSENPDILRFLYTFLNFGKKLSYVDSSFNDIALRDWLGIEKRLASHVYDGIDVAVMRIIIHHMLPRFEVKDFRPKFGPGSVSERGVRGRLGKIRNLAYDPLIDRFLFHGHTGKYGYGEGLGLQPTRVIPDMRRWNPEWVRESKPPSRLKFVPKNIKVARSICIEPNVNMYFQQAILREMVRYIHGGPLGRFVDLKDQRRNQLLAQLGSETGLIDTIDLSAASDSVGLRLIKDIFPKSWLIPMLVTRSGVVELPDGSKHSLQKFAPMGSALCFPTQCIIFCAVCLYAACIHVYEKTPSTFDFVTWCAQNIDRVTNLFSSSFTVQESRFQPLSVYGDDICLDSRLTDIAMSILSRLGFSVNRNKSFTGSQAFRESCGGFYLNGSDITPMLFRVDGVGRSNSATFVASCVHLVNECYRRKLKNLHHLLHYSLRSLGNYSLPYVTSDTILGLLCASPVNSHLQMRYNRDYQRDEYLCWTITYEYSESGPDIKQELDLYNYMRWWADRDVGFEVADSAAQRLDRGGCRIKRRWIPLYQP